MRPGDIKVWSGAVANIEANWMLCDGSSLLIASYPTLFANIGTIHGSVDIAHFNIPDLRNFFVVGAQQDDLGVPKSSLEGTLKQGGGATQHNHNIQAGSHTHSVYIDSGGHYHPYFVAGDHAHTVSATGLTTSGPDQFLEIMQGSNPAVAFALDSHVHTLDISAGTDSVCVGYSGSTDNVNVTITGDTGYANVDFGTDQTATLPPWYCLCYIIKVL